MIPEYVLHLRQYPSEQRIRDLFFQTFSVQMSLLHMGRLVLPSAIAKRPLALLATCGWLWYDTDGESACRD